MVNIEKKENLDQQYLEKIENINFRPVFILGHPRSGTSILYNILTKTQCFNFVTAYHIIKYNQLLYNHIHNLENVSKRELNKSFEENNIVNRGIDGLEIHADFAEEYGFLIGDRLVEMSINEKNFPLFLEMAKKIQFISANNKPLLLKNPLDFSNFIYIKKALPKSKFIFIHRNPINTFSSIIKAIRVLFRDKHPYSTQIFKVYNKIFENPLLLRIIRPFFSQLSIFGLIWVTKSSAKVSKYFLKNVKQLSDENYINVTYEELCKNPQDTIENIMNFLNIKIKEKVDFKSFIKPRKTSIEPSVLAIQKFIYKSMKDYFEYFGYELEKGKK